LTGYVPSAEAVQAIGKIGRDVKFNAGTKPGSFFWVLDPVMGDNGKLYIPEDEVPEYKALLREADLILPNQYEAEWVAHFPQRAIANMDDRLLSDTPITDLKSLATAIQVLHKTYQVPHVIITSLRLTRDNHTISSRAPSKPASTAGSGTHTPNETKSLDAATSHPSTWPTSSSQRQAAPINLDDVENLTIIGSTATSDFKPRLFRIDTPQLPLFFSGTGDMFAALTVPRLIEAVRTVPELSSKPSWRSPDDVAPEDLPLAKACQKVLASMQAILGKTTESCGEKMKAYDARVAKEGRGEGEEADAEKSTKRHLALTNASEVVVPRHVKDLIDPPHLERFKPRAVVEGSEVPSNVGERKADELNVLHLGIGPEGQSEVGFQTEVGQAPTEESVDRAATERNLWQSGLKVVEPGVLESKEAEKVKQDMGGGEKS
jgi:pyridoxine kinase